MGVRVSAAPAKVVTFMYKIVYMFTYRDCSETNWRIVNLQHQQLSNSFFLPYGTHCITYFNWNWQIKSNKAKMSTKFSFNLPNRIPPTTVTTTLHYILSTLHYQLCMPALAARASRGSDSHSSGAETVAPETPGRPQRHCNTGL